MTQVRIWTDGSCLGNPGPSGAAALLVCGRHRKIVKAGSSSSTNNRAELSAVLLGLKALKLKSAVTIFTDSQYVIKVASPTRKKIKANLDLVQILDRQLAQHQVKFVYVKGHSGSRHNEWVDVIAHDQARLAKEGLSA